MPRWRQPGRFWDVRIFVGGLKHLLMIEGKESIAYVPGKRAGCLNGDVKGSEASSTGTDLMCMQQSFQT